MQSGIQPDNATNPENTLNQLADKVSAIASLYVMEPVEVADKNKV